MADKLSDIKISRKNTFLISADKKNAFFWKTFSKAVKKSLSDSNALRWSGAFDELIFTGYGEGFSTINDIATGLALKQARKSTSKILDKNKIGGKQLFGDTKLGKWGNDFVNKLIADYSQKIVSSVIKNISGRVQGIIEKKFPKDTEEEKTKKRQNFIAASSYTNKSAIIQKQVYQFYLRSLKPSLWNFDKKIESMGDEENKPEPRGVILLPPSISNLSESYNPSWEQQNILGNTQQLHKYQYTDRKIELTLELYAQNPVELQKNIFRLNWLVDHTYGKLNNFSSIPKSSNESNIPENAKFIQSIEYKEYPFIRLTLGSIFNEVPCYISSLSINYHLDAPWEGARETSDPKDAKKIQWPHWITVTLSFNILFDTIDPTKNAFYSQNGLHDAKNIIETTNFTENAKNIEKEMEKLRDPSFNALEWGDM